MLYFQLENYKKKKNKIKKEIDRQAVVYTQFKNSLCFELQIVNHDSNQDIYNVRLISPEGENINTKYGQLTGSLQTKRSVAASDGFDMKVTVAPPSQGAPRSIAKALGVSAASRSHSSTIPRVGLKV